MIYEVNIDGQDYRLELDRVDGLWQCRLDGREIRLDAILARPDVLSVLIDGKAYEVKREHSSTDLHLWVGSARYAARLRDPRSLRNRGYGAADGGGTRRLLAPMPGKIVRILAQEKAEVEAGQGIIVVEAMKMQNEIKSPKKGILQRILVTEGANVNASDVLAIVE